MNQSDCAKMCKWAVIVTCLAKLGLIWIVLICAKSQSEKLTVARKFNCRERSRKNDGAQRREEDGASGFRNCPCPIVRHSQCLSSLCVLGASVVKLFLINHCFDSRNFASRFAGHGWHTVFQNRGGQISDGRQLNIVVRRV